VVNCYFEKPNTFFFRAKQITSRHGVTYLKFWIFINNIVRTSNFALLIWHCVSEFVDCVTPVFDLGTGTTKFKEGHYQHSSALESTNLYNNPALIFHLLCFVGVRDSVVLQPPIGLLSDDRWKSTEHCGIVTKMRTVTYSKTNLSQCKFFSTNYKWISVGLNPIIPLLEAWPKARPCPTVLFSLFNHRLVLRIPSSLANKKSESNVFPLHLTWK